MNGTTNKIKGRVKEAIGALTNDKPLKTRERWIKLAERSRTISRK
jgi:hypothetical protein